MGNSKLVTYTRLSPNCTHPRKQAIDTVTIHCIVGQWTARQGCDHFAQGSVGAAPNYVVGKDGSIGLCVDEGDRAWTTGGKDKNGRVIRVNGISGADNDQRAITIEVASDTKHPYAITAEAMEALVSLLVDICRRNPGIGRLRWRGDKTLVGRVEQQNMTVHRWFANKACPGDYLYERHGALAEEVNRRLEKEEKTMKEKDSTPADWEKAGVEWALEKGLLLGDEEGDLMLHAPITRAQLCVMLKRYHDKMG